MALNLRQILFPLYILRTNCKFPPDYINAFILINSEARIVIRHFHTFVLELWPSDLRKNFVSAKYLESKLTDFYPILYI